MPPYLFMFPCSACVSNGFISDLWYLWSDFTLCSCDKSARWCSQSSRMMEAASLRGKVWISTSSIRRNVWVCLSLGRTVCFLKCVWRFNPQNRNKWKWLEYFTFSANLHQTLNYGSLFVITYISWLSDRDAEAKSYLTLKSFKISLWPVWSFTKSAREIY